MINTLLVKEPSRKYPRYSEGALLVLRNKHLVFVYTRFYGGSSDNASAQIVFSRADENGLNWSEEKVLINNNGLMNVMSVSLLRVKESIFVFYILKNSLSDCKLYYRITNDNFEELSEAFCATPANGYFVVNNDRVLCLNSGRLMYPAAYHACSDGTYKTWESRAVSRCFFSDDNGQSWAPASNDIGLELETNSGMQEPGIVQKTDGSILLWARTDLGKQYCSLSSDNGLSWSKARPSKLKSPLSPATIKQMPWDGRLLAVWNDHGGIHPYMLGRRTPLSVAVSADGGKSWSKSKCIESELSGWYCYTAMEFLENKVLLAYCAGDTRVGLLNRTKVVSIERAFFDTM